MRPVEVRRDVGLGRRAGVRRAEAAGIEPTRRDLGPRADPLHPPLLSLDRAVVELGVAAPEAVEPVRGLRGPIGRGGSPAGRRSLRSADGARGGQRAACPAHEAHADGTSSHDRPPLTVDQLGSGVPSLQRSGPGILGSPMRPRAASGAFDRDALDVGPVTARPGRCVASRSSNRFHAGPNITAIDPVGPLRRWAAILKVGPEPGR